METKSGPNQENAIRFARVELQKQPWYRGVDLISVPSEEFCKHRMIDAIRMIVEATEIRDGMSDATRILADAMTTRDSSTK